MNAVPLCTWKFTSTSAGTSKTCWWPPYCWFCFRTCWCRASMCFVRLSLYLVLCWQKEHLNLGSIPHSNMWWRFKWCLCLYALPQVLQVCLYVIFWMSETEKKIYRLLVRLDFVVFRNNVTTPSLPGAILDERENLRIFFLRHFSFLAIHPFISYTFLVQRWIWYNTKYVSQWCVNINIKR